MTAAHDAGVEPIAIVGMAARVPGARDIKELWRNLVDGVESIVPASREEMLARGASWRRSTTRPGCRRPASSRTSTASTRACSA